MEDGCSPCGDCVEVDAYLYMSNILINAFRWKNVPLWGRRHPIEFA